jgi:hypothetical protein
MEGLLELAGTCLAWAYAAYGLFLLLVPAFLFVDLLLLAAVAWAVAARDRRRTPGASQPVVLRRWARLPIEVVFGLVNPMLYLAVLAPSLPGLGPGPERWRASLHALAWVLLAAFWALRVLGAALGSRSPVVRAGVRGLLGAALASVLAYALKDAWLLAGMEGGTTSPLRTMLVVLRVCPLYLVPAVLLWDYLRAVAPGDGAWRGLLLLPGRAARLAVAGVAGLALVTAALSAHRRSDAAVRRLVRDHREPILAAADRYGVDPRLVASIVYVTHRDQLSPFRGALERVVVTAWARNLRRDFGLLPPDGTGEGADENPLLNQALDVSVGLAQIKPRTALAASVLATGRIPGELPRPLFFAYRDVEPVGDGWTAAARPRLEPPIPVPAEKHVVAGALLDACSNLATCALILALYQGQWRAAHPAWDLRRRPDILATLYQIGFARSRPHGAPRRNAFGARVLEVHGQPWLGELLAAPRPAS